MTCSNYTTQIESDVINKRFVYSMQSNSCFAAFSKVKSNIKDKAIPDISKDELNYFHYDFKEDIQQEVVYNIDLKSAYASILYQEGYIKKDTLDYLSKISKYDRLASVGMLAAKKQIFHFGRSGNILRFQETVSDKENFFYLAVQRTFEIMQNLKAIIGEGYLFTWVDGIYFMPDRGKLIACENYLRKLRLRYSEDILRDWSVKIKNGGIRISFIKENKHKVFNLPGKETKFQQIMGEAKSLLNNKINKYAFRKTQLSDR